jgi:hypothetical protein
MFTRDDDEQFIERAGASRSKPVRGPGQTGRSHNINFKIVSLDELLGWLLGQAKLKAQIEQAARTIMGKHLQSLDVETIERATIPGLELRIVRDAAGVRD